MSVLSVGLLRLSMAPRSPQLADPSAISRMNQADSTHNDNNIFLLLNTQRRTRTL